MQVLINRYNNKAGVKELFKIIYVKRYRISEILFSITYLRWFLYKKSEFILDLRPLARNSHQA